MEPLAAMKTNVLDCSCPNRVVSNVHDLLVQPVFLGVWLFRGRFIVAPSSYIKIDNKYIFIWYNFQACDISFVTPLVLCTNVIIYYSILMLMFVFV